jgi:hypothetical protein
MTRHDDGRFDGASTYPRQRPVLQIVTIDSTVAGAPCIALGTIFAVATAMRDRRMEAGGELLTKEWCPMTFVVLSVENEREKVVGTIWADGEAQARLMASNVYQPASDDSIRVKQVEQRELPLRLPQA